MHPPWNDQPKYPLSGAFVVQFHATADPKAGRFIGRIEQVVSGYQARFSSFEELLAFLSEHLGEQRPQVPANADGSRG